jgi:ubiquinone/menaquinone biosynthesis C-methylase UbiE
MKFVLPEVVTSQFHLRPGDSVADFGAGNGYFMRPLADAVGREGSVYLIEIQKEIVTFLTEQVRTGGFDQVHPVWCDLETMGGVPIPDSALDAVIVCNTFFQIEDKQTMISEVSRTLRSGGKLFVIDWTETVSGLGPALGQLVPAETVTALFEQAGFLLERDFPAGEHHYGLAFRWS